MEKIQPLNGNVDKYSEFSELLEEEQIAEEGPMQQDLFEDMKKIFSHFIKKITIGSDLTRVPFPLFVHSPVSLLQRIALFHSFTVFLREAAADISAEARMMLLMKWYLAGFQLKPRGVKKPWNPIMGEVFRSEIVEENSENRVLYISEQVSHHPPVSAFTFVDSKGQFVVEGNLSPKSKFFGTSIGCELSGNVIVHFLQQKESFEITYPDAQCRGFIFGPVTVELTGDIHITPLEGRSSCFGSLSFKKKGIMGSEYNVISGKIYDNSKTHKHPIVQLKGHWDGSIFVTRNHHFHVPHFSYQPSKDSLHHHQKQEKQEQKEAKEELFWSREDAKTAKAKRHIFMLKESDLMDFESEKVWKKVNLAVKNEEENEGNNAKQQIEDHQRMLQKQRESKGEQWIPKLYAKDPQGFWTYKWLPVTSWDATKTKPVEKDGIIQFISLSSSSSSPSSF